MLVDYGQGGSNEFRDKKTYVSNSNRSQNICVIKAGGSFLDNIESYLSIANYTKRKAEDYDKIIIVPSAMKDVTNILVSGYNDNKKSIEKLREKYEPIIKSLGTECKNQFDHYFINLSKISDMDEFVVQGERHSGTLMNYFLRELGLESNFITGYDAGIILDRHGSVMEESIGNICKHLPESKIVVLSGFEGREKGYKRIKMGDRNINDGIATACACSFGPNAVTEILRGTDYILSVNPAFNITGKAVRNLSYHEATGLSRAGAEFLHPSAMIFGKKYGNKIYVKSPKSEGTLISDKSDSTIEKPVIAMDIEKYIVLSVANELMDTKAFRGTLEQVLLLLYEFSEFNVLDLGTQMNSFSISLKQDKKNENNDRSHLIKEKVEKYLINTDKKSVVSMRPVYGITFVGDAMQNRYGTLGQLAGIAGKNKLSITMPSQGDEKITHPFITFYFEKDIAEKAANVFASELDLKSKNNE